MTHSLRTAIAAATLVAAGVFLAPAAAQASSIYPPTGSCTTSPTTMTPGGTITFSCSADTFSANETVAITVTGENGSAATIGMLRFAISTASGSATSSDDGSLPGVKITLPSNASGTYNIAAVSPTSAGGTAPTTIAGADGGLPATGITGGSTMGVWIGGGALVLAGAALAVAATLRRTRRSD